jgi:atypical dual specificity phosphatase
MKCSWIEPGILAASSIPISPEDILALHDQGIRAILTLTEHPITTFRGLTADLFRELDIVYQHVGVVDQCAPDDAGVEQILQFFAEMRDQNRAALVHCHAGIGRTGTALHLYYLAQGLSMEQTQDKIRRTRSQCILLSQVQIAFLDDFVRSRQE